MESVSCFNVLSPRILRMLLPAMALLSFLVQQTSASFNNTKGWQSYNSTMTDAYLGYSNNPWGPSTLLAGATSNRSKRSVVHLYNMVLCATGCNPLSYKGYGCYCGFLGSGYPTDPIDRCCKMHDWCYNAANCPMFLEYFVPYVWTCYRRRPLCGVGTSCAQRLCECDRKLAECLARYPCPRTRAVCTSSPWRLFQNLIML